jgi:AraC family transcriptional regulator
VFVSFKTKSRPRCIDIRMVTCEIGLQPTRGVVTSRIDGRELSVALIELSGPAALPEHRHDEGLVIVLVRGDFREVTANRTLEHAPFSVCVHPELTTHTAEVGLFGAMLLVVTASAGIPKALLGERRESGLLSGLVSVDAVRLFTAVAFEDAPLVVESRALELLWSVKRAMPRPDAPDWMARAVRRVMESYASPLTATRLAEEVGVAPRAVADAFMERFGRTVDDVLKRVRVWKACEALSRGAPSLSALALDLGFTDDSHFSRAFSGVVGRPPGRFRDGLRRFSGSEPDASSRPR